MFSALLEASHFRFVFTDMALHKCTILSIRLIINVTCRRTRQYAQHKQCTCQQQRHLCSPLRHWWKWLMFSNNRWSPWWTTLYTRAACLINLLKSICPRNEHCYHLWEAKGGEPTWAMGTTWPYRQAGIRPNRFCLAQLIWRKQGSVMGYAECVKSVDIISFLIVVDDLVDGCPLP